MDTGGLNTGIAEATAENRAGAIVRKLFWRRTPLMSRTELATLEQELLQQKTKLAEKELELNYKMEAGRIHFINPDKIAPNPAQPRRSFCDASIVSLADSIQRSGILQPLSVRPAERDKKDGYFGPDSSFVLIAGERRLRAAKLLHLETVPCIIIDADSRQSAELALIENLQRENLNMFEQAGAIASLIDIYRLTQEQIARQLSVSQSFVANKLRILRLSLPERDFILETGLTERHARALLRVTDIERRKKALATIARKKMNVSQAEEYIDRFLSDAEEKPNTPVHRIILKDIRLFINVIEKAVSTVREAGIAVDSQKDETEDEICWVLKIPKKA